MIGANAVRKSNPTLALISGEFPPALWNLWCLTTTAVAQHEGHEQGKGVSRISLGTVGTWLSEIFPVDHGITDSPRGAFAWNPRLCLASLSTPRSQPRHVFLEWGELWLSMTPRHGYLGPDPPWLPISFPQGSAIQFTPERRILPLKGERNAPEIPSNRAHGSFSTKGFYWAKAAHEEIVGPCKGLSNPSIPNLVHAAPSTPKLAQLFLLSSPKHSEQHPSFWLFHPLFLI